MKTAMNPNRHPLEARHVKVDLSQTPLHWIHGDVLASHITNAIHLLLPEGELWFCRVYHQALPLITDPQLRADVEGFIRQEAIHAKEHTKAQRYLHRHGIDTHPFVGHVRGLFRTVLGDAPFGIRALQRPFMQKRWLLTRVGLIAAIEHFTGILGQWAMDNTSWDNADPAMADLFKWHLAEEVEHRCVAFDLYQHLSDGQTGFYLKRQALMALVFPLFIFAVMSGARELAGQDKHAESQRIARMNLLQILRGMERTGVATDNVPSFTFLARATLRWIAPRFHPITEGNTEQALAYIARSPAAQAAI